MCPSARSSSSGPRLLPSCPLAAPPRHGGGGGTIGEARGFFSAPELSPCVVPRGSAAAAAFPLASRGRRRAGAFAPPAGPHSNLGREKGIIKLVKGVPALRGQREDAGALGVSSGCPRSSHKLTELGFRLRSPLSPLPPPGRSAQSRGSQELLCIFCSKVLSLGGGVVGCHQGERRREAGLIASFLLSVNFHSEGSSQCLPFAHDGLLACFSSIPVFS